MGVEDPQLTNRDNLVFMMKKLTSTLPAKVLYVNYENCSVDVEVTITTEITTDRFVPYPKFYSVPLMIYSANGGKARQTMPIKRGDVVELTFADRDTVNWLCSNGQKVVHPESSYPLSMGGQHYVLVAKPCITLSANARPIDPDNVVTENENSIITQAPDGTTTITNSKGATVTLNKDNEFTFSSGSATLDINSQGELLFNGSSVIINGLYISATGNLITQKGANLDVLKQMFLDHIHTGVKSGSDNTGKIV